MVKSLNFLVLLFALSFTAFSQEIYTSPVQLHTDLVGKQKITNSPVKLLVKRDTVEKNGRKFYDVQVTVVGAANKIVHTFNSTYSHKMNLKENGIPFVRQLYSADTSFVSYVVFDSYRTPKKVGKGSFKESIKFVPRADNPDKEFPSIHYYIK